MTPTARSLALLRAEGFLCAVVESWVPHAGIRRDLFGFADVLGVHPRDGLFLLVQTTTADHLAHRLKKARARPELAVWLRAGGKFEVHGWRRLEGRWTCRRVPVCLAHLEAALIAVRMPPRRRRQGRQRLLFAGEW